MSAVAEQTAFGRWLEEMYRARGLNRSQFSQYEPRINYNTVTAWVRDGRIPSPKYCRLIAEKLRIPVEEVYRAAGHDAGDDDRANDAELPEWADLITYLDDEERGVVERVVRAFAERPSRYDSPEDHAEDER